MQKEQLEADLNLALQGQGAARAKVRLAAQGQPGSMPRHSWQEALSTPPCKVLAPRRPVPKPPAVISRQRLGCRCFGSSRNAGLGVYGLPAQPPRQGASWFSSALFAQVTGPGLAAQAPGIGKHRQICTQVEKHRLRPVSVLLPKVRLNSTFRHRKAGRPLPRQSNVQSPHHTPALSAAKPRTPKPRTSVKEASKPTVPVHHKSHVDGTSAKVEEMRMAASAQIGVSFGDALPTGTAETTNVPTFNIIADDSDGDGTA